MINERVGRDESALLRRVWLRQLVGVVLGLASIGLYAAAGWVVLLDSPALFLGLFVAVVCAVAVAVVLLRGRWSARRVPRLAQWLAAAGALGTLLSLAAVAVATGIDALGSRATVGAAASEARVAFLAGGVLLAVCALVAASLPTRLPRRLVGSVLAIVLAAGMGSVAAAAMDSALARPGCETLQLTTASWRKATSGSDDVAEVSDGERLAAAVVRCRLLQGRGRGEVRRMLGSPTGREGRDGLVWFVGWTNDGLGPGDAQHLIVRFADERVVSAALAYP